ncbi:MAG: NAD(P)H-hydrate epimerase [Chloroflexi bacterium]|nr:MAG: NAD(P)H-hydrate epimerase [Chloroflexota bacterium]
MTAASNDLRARFGSLRSEDVAALDHAAQEIGISTMQLMEIAGWQVARCAWHMIGERPGTIAVVAGRGNNGGDGLVAARHLATWGCDVRTWVIAAETDLTGLVASHAETARRNGVSITVSTHIGAVRGSVDGVDLMIDGILGTGLHTAPRPPQAAAIEALNASSSPVLAIDVPSGLDATTGEVFTPSVLAAATCTLVGVKAGLWASRALAGDLWVADIGMPRAAWDACGLTPPTDVRAGALVSVPSGTSKMS